MTYCYTRTDTKVFPSLGKTVTPDNMIDTDTARLVRAFRPHAFKQWRPLWKDPAEMLEQGMEVRGWVLAGLAG